MLIKLWIRLSGGFWRFRTICLGTRPGCSRRVRTFVYSQYLESLGSYISLAATFAGEPIFPHKPMGIFIAPEARIGRGATIYQQVTIGSNETAGSPRNGSPIIGNDVFIGAGAKIIGAVRVGDGARIAAGAVVVTDVPSRTVARSPKAAWHQVANRSGVRVGST